MNREVINDGVLGSSRFRSRFLQHSVLDAASTSRLIMAKASGSILPRPYALAECVFRQAW